MQFQIIEVKVVIFMQKNDMKLINMYVHIEIVPLSETEFYMHDDVKIIILFKP